MSKQRFAIVPDCFRTDNKQHKLLTEDDMFFLVGSQVFKMFMLDVDNTSMFTMKMFFEYYNVKSRKTIENLYKSVNKLYKLKIINLINSSSKNITQNDILTVNYPSTDNSFTKVNFKYVDRIWNDQDSNIQQKKAMLYIYVILESYQGSNDFSYLSIRTMRNITGFGLNRINRSIKRLDEIGVMNFISLPTMKNGEQYIRPNNVYTIGNDDNAKDRLERGSKKSKQLALDNKK